MSGMSNLGFAIKTAALAVAIAGGGTLIMKAPKIISENAKLQREVQCNDSTIKVYEDVMRANANLKKAFVLTADSIQKAAIQHKLDSINAEFLKQATKTINRL